MKQKQLKVLLVFPGVRQQHVERLEALQSLDEVDTARLIYFEEQKFGVSGVPGSALTKEEPGLKAAKNILADVKPDIIFCAGWFDPNVLTYLLLGVQRGLPTCLMSESTLYENSGGVIKYFFKSHIVRNARFYLVGGKAQSDLINFLAGRLAKGNIYHGYNCRNNSFFSTVVKDNPNYNLCVSRFVGRKNIDAVIEAYRIVTNERSIPLPPLRIVGSGPNEAIYRHKIKTYCLDNLIQIEPPASQKELREIYKGAKFLIFPSLFEQWGFVCNEALATGTPVIVSNTLGCKELYEYCPKVTGLSFSPDKPYELANCLELTNHLDYQTLSQNAREVVADFDVSALYTRSVKEILSRSRDVYIRKRNFDVSVLVIYIWFLKWFSPAAAFLKSARFNRASE